MSDQIIAYIALGSNLDHPKQQITTALQTLAKLDNSKLVQCSSFYQSQALGPGKQPDYINAVAALATRLTPHKLLNELMTIETAQGRVRTERWGARTLDLDILLYGDLTMDTAKLQIPHPRMHQRRFVLEPLAEINPELILPAPYQQSLKALLQQCTKDSLIKV